MKKQVLSWMTVLMVLAVTLVTCQSCRSPSMPHDAVDAEEIVTRNGLFWKTDVISEKPLTADEMAYLHAGRSKEDWQGHVRVSRCRDANGLCVPDWHKVARWGEFTIYGDPELVERILQFK